LGRCASRDGSDDRDERQDICRRARPDAVILFHGLEGGSESHYAGALMKAVATIGWRGVIPHFRGCSGELNRAPRAYHSGDHEEVGAILAAIRARVPKAHRLSRWRFVGRARSSTGWDAPGRANHALWRAAVSTPLDLTAAGNALGKGLNRIYTRNFLGTLKPKSIALANRHPDLLDETMVRRARTMFEFDDAVTAPLHGFDGAADYWRRASSKRWLPTIALPTLVLNAKNDPFVPAASLPSPGEASSHVLLEQPDNGGHVGFLTGPFPGHIDWLPSRLLHFFVHRG
jgi:predicted alpha/beta-fold hydrolase